MRDAHKPITALQHILTDVKDKERPDEKTRCNLQDDLLRLPGYLYWGDWKKLKHTTYRAVTSLKDTTQDKPHAQTSPTNETQHSLGFGNMHYIQN